MVTLRATVDVSADPPEVRIEPVTGDTWQDFGYWLEAFAVIAQYARDHQGWDAAQILGYINDYLARAIGDYDLKPRD